MHSIKIENWAWFIFKHITSIYLLFHLQYLYQDAKMPGPKSLADAGLCQAIQKKHGTVACRDPNAEVLDISIAFA